MIYCQKRNKGGMLYYYQKESTIKNYPDYPLSFKNSIQFYPLINYWRYEFLNVKPGNHFFLFPSSENNSISDICKIICFEEEYRIYSNIFYDSFKSSGIFQLKFIVNSTYRIQIGKCLDSPEFNMTVINKYNNEVEYSNTSKTDLNYITGDKEYLVEFTVNMSKSYISTFKISFEKLQNKYAYVLDFDNFLYVPLFSIENVGIQNFFLMVI